MNIADSFSAIDVVTTSGGRLEVSYDFYNIEAYLWRHGERMAGKATLDFARTMRKTLRNRLAGAGALGPFKLTIRRGDGCVTPHSLVMWEAY
jgi:hypothetical protein